MTRDLVIIGAGGYAQELVWVAEEMNSEKATWNILGYIDPADLSRRGQLLYDHTILGGWSDFKARKDIYFCCGLGDVFLREKECTEAERRGFRPATLVHPSVIIARHVTLGEGTVVGARSILCPYSTVGRHCALNIGVGVGHNTQMGDFCVLSPYAQVLGGVVLADKVCLGANSTVYMKRHMGTGSVLGANSFLLTDLAPAKSAIGIPASSFAGSKRAVNKEIAEVNQ